MHRTDAAPNPTKWFWWIRRQGSRDPILLNAKSIIIKWWQTISWDRNMRYNQKMVFWGANDEGYYKTGRELFKNMPKKPYHAQSSQKLQTNRALIYYRKTWLPKKDSRREKRKIQAKSSNTLLTENHPSTSNTIFKSSSNLPKKLKLTNVSAGSAPTYEFSTKNEEAFNELE